MWWKIYFWLWLLLHILAIYFRLWLLLTIATLAFVYGQLKTSAFADIFWIAWWIITTLGIYSYVFKKRALSFEFWKYLFWISILLLILEMGYEFSPLEEDYPFITILIYGSIPKPSSGYEPYLVIDALLELPALYAFYKLGYYKDIFSESKKEVKRLKNKPIGRRKLIIALLLSIFVGTLGIDRFYMGRILSGVLKLLTFGGLGIWWLIDLILIATNNLQDGEGKYLQS